MMQEWLLKLIIEWAAKWLIGKIGHSATADHMASVLSKYTPLPEEPTPADSRNPNKTNHFGGL